MKRFIFTFLIVYFLFAVPFTLASQNQENDVSQYTRDLSTVRKSLIDLKRDFYTYKIAQDKKEQLQQPDQQSGFSQVQVSSIIFAFGLNLLIILFFIWQTSKGLKKKDQGIEKRLESQKNSLFGIEQKLQEISAKKMKEKGLRLKLIKEGEELIETKSSYIELLKELLASYDELIESNPQNDKYLFYKAEMEAYLDRKVSAIHDLKKAIQLNPKWKEKAKKSFYFKSVRNFNEFRKIVGN